MAKKAKDRVYRTPEQKKKLVAKIEALIEKGTDVAAARRGYDIWPLQFRLWQAGKAMGGPQRRNPATRPASKPRRQYRRPPAPVTIEIPDTAPMCVLYGPTDQILKALQILRG